MIFEEVHYSHKTEMLNTGEKIYRLKKKDQKKTNQKTNQKDSHKIITDQTQDLSSSTA